MKNLSDTTDRRESKAAQELRRSAKSSYLAVYRDNIESVLAELAAANKAFKQCREQVVAVVDDRNNAQQQLAAVKKSNDDLKDFLRITPCFPLNEWFSKRDLLISQSGIGLESELCKSSPLIREVDLKQQLAAVTELLRYAAHARLPLGDTVIEHLDFERQKLISEALKGGKG